eukprot:GEZU01007081.1.p1 GENE.GEZU01007081.1~~GEZU01007081.1.p1  ORF type:complete len:303 (-),score=100.02 GEZU01007081.1:76-954(-)
MTDSAYKITQLSKNKCFGGYVIRYSHHSNTTHCEMRFHVYLPSDTAPAEGKYPVLYWLSGLTCTDENFVQKAGAFKYAAEAKVALVCPDTSPRGVPIPGDSDSWDFGVGAGFYVNATEEDWKKNYNMFDYVTKELPALLKHNFGNDLLNVDNASIFGHSMGGHGALICYLKTGQYKSVSAFAPICNPMNCPWGQKAFSGYLGADKEKWKQYDATYLMENEYNGPKTEILIDQGTADKFLGDKQLLPEAFAQACEKKQNPLTLRMQQDYDHSYFFISTFIEDHIKFHAKYLRA